MLKGNASSCLVSPGVATPNFSEILTTRSNAVRYLGVPDMVKAIFCLSKSLNKLSPKTMEKNYPGVRKVGAQTRAYAFSQFLPKNLRDSWKDPEKSNPLLVGEAYTNAAVTGTCMLCLKECPGKVAGKANLARLVLRYGIPACPSCLDAKDARLDLHDISLDMVPLLDVAHICHTKVVSSGRRIKGDDRKSKGQSVRGSNEEKAGSRIRFCAVEKEIVVEGKVVYPRERTLEYFLANNKDEIEEARQVSEALNQRAKDVDEWSNARRIVDLIRQIERASGQTLGEFLEDIPGWMRPYCFRFEHGKDCTDAVELAEMLEGINVQPHFKSLWDTGSIGMETLLEKFRQLSVGSANDVVIRAATKKHGERSNITPDWLALVSPLISSPDDCCLLHGELMGRTSVYSHFFNAFCAEKNEGTGGGGDGFFHGAVRRVVRDAGGVAVEVAQRIIRESMTRLVRQTVGDFPSSLEWLVERAHSFANPTEFLGIVQELVDQGSGSAAHVRAKRLLVPEAGSATIDIASVCKEIGFNVEFAEKKE